MNNIYIPFYYQINIIYYILIKINITCNIKFKYMSTYFRSYKTCV